MNDTFEALLSHFHSSHPAARLPWSCINYPPSKGFRGFQMICLDLSLIIGHIWLKTALSKRSHNTCMNNGFAEVARAVAAGAGKLARWALNICSGCPVQHECLQLKWYGYICSRSHEQAYLFSHYMGSCLSANYGIHILWRGRQCLSLRRR